MPSPAPDPVVPAERVYVLDSHGLIFQMFHGVPAGMTAADGRPTNAVFGVTRAIMDLYDRGADYLLAAFDLPGPTFRCDLDQNYKAHRPPVPPDLIVQEPMIRAVFEAMGIPVLSHEGFEADDVMATIAERGGCGRQRGQSLHERQGLPATVGAPRADGEPSQGRNARRRWPVRRLGHPALARH